eukprot:scaffold644_cov113-Cylindrotheca_fusiformis.AAC.1
MPETPTAFVSSFDATGPCGQPFFESISPPWKDQSLHAASMLLDETKPPNPLAEDIQDCGTTPFIAVVSMPMITHIDQNLPEDHGAPDWTEAFESGGGDLHQRLVVPIDEPKTHAACALFDCLADMGGWSFVGISRSPSDVVSQFSVWLTIGLCPACSWTAGATS